MDTPGNLSNQPKFVERAQAKLKVLKVLNRSPDVSSLRVPPGNGLERLKMDGRIPKEGEKIARETRPLVTG